MIAFRSGSEIRAQLFQQFPLLRNADWTVNSPWDTGYQCIAWAACRPDHIWWPWDHPSFYWPPGFAKLPIYSPVPVSHFAEMFEKRFGYSHCVDPTYEFGYQKVAIYANYLGVTHMARQHFWGKGWLSKLGQQEDIIHKTVRDIEDHVPNATDGYGNAVYFMRRSWWTALKKLCLLRCIKASLRLKFYRLIVPWNLSS